MTVMQSPTGASERTADSKQISSNNSREMAVSEGVHRSAWASFGLALVMIAFGVCFLLARQMFTYFELVDIEPRNWAIWQVGLVALVATCLLALSLAFVFLVVHVLYVILVGPQRKQAVEASSRDLGQYARRVCHSNARTPTSSQH